MVNLGPWKDVFGTDSPTNGEFKKKFGTLDPDIATIREKVSADILKKYTGTEKPTKE